MKDSSLRTKKVPTLQAESYVGYHFLMENMQIQNLFIDANCAIHPCCHPSENPPKNESEMMKRVNDYLLKIINIANVTDTVYIAIDGVCPRSKVEQQKYRRFRSANLNKIWDTNAISPGTKFMNDLNMSIIHI